MDLPLFGTSRRRYRGGMRGAWLGLAAAIGCGPDEAVPEPQGLAPVCGEEGPVELLRLDTHPWVWAIGGSSDLQVSVGGRSVVLDECGDLLAEVDPSVQGFYWLDDTLLGWTRDEQPGSDEPIFDLQAWPEYGGEPTPVARRVWTAAWENGRLVLERDETLTRGRLLWVHSDANGLTVDELVDGVDLETNPGFGFVPVGARVLIQTIDDGVQSIDPRTGDSEVVLGPVPRWTANLRWLAYAEAPGAAGFRSVFVRDRESGVEHRLASDVPGAWRASVFLTSEHVLTVGDGHGAARWFHLDPPREIEVPHDASVLWVHPDGAAWWFLPEDDGVLGSLWFQPSPSGQTRVRHGEWMWRIGAGEDSVDFGTRRHDGFVDVDRATPDGRLERIAVIESSRYHRDDRGRYLTSKARDEYGPLVFYDGVDPEGQTVVPAAHRDSTNLSTRYGELEDILYESDPASGTHALFRARIAAQD